MENWNLEPFYAPIGLNHYKFKPENFIFFFISVFVLDPLSNPCMGTSTIKKTESSLQLSEMQQGNQDKNLQSLSSHAKQRDGELRKKYY